jgi:hypothetical protein
VAPVPVLKFYILKIYFVTVCSMNR